MTTDEPLRYPFGDPQRKAKKARDFARNYGGGLHVEPRPRARCAVCSHWFYQDTLAAVEVLTLRWPVLICRQCLKDALKQIHGKQSVPIDGKF